MRIAEINSASGPMAEGVRMQNVTLILEGLNPRDLPPIPRVYVSIVTTAETALFSWAMTIDGPVNWLLGSPVGETGVGSLLQLDSNEQRTYGAILLEEVRRRIEALMTEHGQHPPGLWKLEPIGGVSIKLRQPVPDAT